MGCCGSSKKIPDFYETKKKNKFNLKITGANNNRLPTNFAPPYPKDHFDINRFMKQHLQIQRNSQIESQKYITSRNSIKQVTH